MDMFEFSIQMEKDAEALYRKLADSISAEGIKKVLNMLADDEVRHRKNIEILRQKMEAEPGKGSAMEIKTVFEKIKEDIKSETVNEDVVKDYEKAREIEEKGISFYKEQFAKTEDPKSRKLFESLMKQEKYHLKTVDNLIDLVRKPEWWVEHAEFTPMGDDYY